MSELYEFPPSRSQRVRWLLRELGLDYDSNLVNLEEGEQKSAEYLAVHPLGVVPAYKSDDYIMLESVAITMQLIDEHPESGLAPPIGTPERAAYYQWCVFSCAELDYPLTRITWNELVLPEDQRDPASAKAGHDQFRPRAEMLSNHLRDRNFVLGKSFSGADILIGYNCFWATLTDSLASYPVLKTYLRRLQDRPAYQEAFGF